MAELTYLEAHLLWLLQNKFFIDSEGNFPVKGFKKFYKEAKASLSSRLIGMREASAQELASLALFISCSDCFPLKRN
jgi:hypothetical protein